MAISREAVEGVVRLSGVYTPPERRKHGYATACVHALSKTLRDAGYRSILYTDLGNTTSNSIYRRIGYRAVAEALGDFQGAAVSLPLAYVIWLDGVRFRYFGTHGLLWTDALLNRRSVVWRGRVPLAFCRR